MLQCLDNEVEVQSLDAATNNVPNKQPVLRITSTYEGQPPGNACKFIECIGRLRINRCLVFPMPYLLRKPYIGPGTMSLLFNADPVL